MSSGEWLSEAAGAASSAHENPRVIQPNMDDIRAIVRQHVQVVACIVPISSVAKFKKMVKVLRIKGIAPITEPLAEDVQSIDGASTKTHRIVLLDTSLKLADLSSEVLSLTAVPPALRFVSVEYEHLAAAEVFELLLPKSVPSVSSQNMVGSLCQVNLSGTQLPWRFVIGAVLLDKTPGLRTVVMKTGTIASCFRAVPFEVIAGDTSPITTVKEHGLSYVMDYSAVYWNSRLQTEHSRLAAFILAWGEPKAIERGERAKGKERKTANISQASTLAAVPNAVNENGSCCPVPGYRHCVHVWDLCAGIGPFVQPIAAAVKALGKQQARSRTEGGSESEPAAGPTNQTHGALASLAPNSNSRSTAAVLRFAPSRTFVPNTATFGSREIPIGGTRTTVGAIVACDLNPSSIEWLHKSFELNRLTNVTAAVGDARALAYHGIRDLCSSAAAIDAADEDVCVVSTLTQREGCASCAAPLAAGVSSAPEGPAGHEDREVATKRRRCDSPSPAAVGSARGPQVGVPIACTPRERLLRTGTFASTVALSATPAIHSFHFIMNLPSLAPEFCRFFWSGAVAEAIAPSVSEGVPRFRVDFSQNHASCCRSVDDLFEIVVHCYGFSADPLDPCGDMAARVVANLCGGGDGGDLHVVETGGPLPTGDPAYTIRPQAAADDDVSDHPEDAERAAAAPSASVKAERAARVAHWAAFSQEAAAVEPVVCASPVEAARCVRAGGPGMRLRGPQGVLLQLLRSWEVRDVSRTKIMIAVSVLLTPPSAPMSGRASASPSKDVS